MQPVNKVGEGSLPPPVDNNSKKKIIVALIVVAGVAATVSVVALAVLIPPVGAAVGAALIAAAVKVSIGAGVGSVLCGGAAYLIHKFNKPKDPKNSSKSEIDLKDSDSKPSILAKPLVARTVETNVMADFQAIRKQERKDNDLGFKQKPAIQNDSSLASFNADMKAELKKRETAKLKIRAENSLKEFNEAAKNALEKMDAALLNDAAEKVAAQKVQQARLDSVGKASEEIKLWARAEISLNEFNEASKNALQNMDSALNAHAAEKVAAQKVQQARLDSVGKASEEIKLWARAEISLNEFNEASKNALQNMDAVLNADAAEKVAAQQVQKARLDSVAKTSEEIKLWARAEISLNEFNEAAKNVLQNMDAVLNADAAEKVAAQQVQKARLDSVGKASEEIKLWARAEISLNEFNEAAKNVLQNMDAVLNADAAEKVAAQQVQKARLDSVGKASEEIKLWARAEISLNEFNEAAKNVLQNMDAVLNADAAEKVAAQQVQKARLDSLKKDINDLAMQIPSSPVQSSRTPSPLDEVEKLNQLMISVIERDAPVNLQTSLIKEPMPHIGKDLTDEIPVSLLQKIVSDENVPMENTSPPSGNVIEEPNRNLIGTFEVIDCKFDGPLELNSYLNCGIIDDTTSVTFHKGKLVARDTIDELVNPKGALLAILKANFRSELVDDLIRTFRFETRTDFTAADFKRIVVTLLASLQDKDVRMLFNTVKGTARNEDKIGCASLISDEDKAYLNAFDSFDDVDQKGRKILMNTYYKLVIFDLNNVVPTSPEMLADLEIVQAYHSILPQLRRKEQEKLSRAEYLAKTLAYLELQVGQIVKVPKNAEEEDLYIVVEHLDHKEHKDETQAVICRILVPYQKNKSDAIILVRGTQTGSQVAALNSLIRDADYEGVGKGSFDRASPEIFKMVERTVSNLSGDVKLEIHGHSLAGVDAQRVMHLIISKMCAGLLASVKKIFHFSHNPPGVSQAEADDFNKKVDALDPNIDLEMNFITFSGDLISWFGSIYNGAKRKDNRIKGSFYHAVTNRYLLAAHTCVSTKNDLALAKPGETITDKNVFYEVCDLNSDIGKKYLLKSYASKFAAFHVWRRYVLKYTVHKLAFDFVVRAFGRVERKLEDRVKKIMA